MAREYTRSQRVGDFLKQELASLIQQEIRDPRVGMVSITDVEVSRDMSHAKVYATVLGIETKADAEESMTVLNRAAGFLRTQLARNSNARTTPRLHFYFDASVARGQHLSALIEQAVAADGQADNSDDSADIITDKAPDNEAE